jgi:hypothetical protein
MDLEGSCQEFGETGDWDTGFEIREGRIRQLPAPTGWFGRGPWQMTSSGEIARNVNIQGEDASPAGNVIYHFHL